MSIRTDGSAVTPLLVASAGFVTPPPGSVEAARNTHVRQLGVAVDEEQEEEEEEEEEGSLAESTG